MKSGRARPSGKQKTSLLKSLAAPAVDTVLSQYTTNKVLLIHPSSRYGKLLIAALIDASPCELFCYGMGVEDVSLDQFLIGISNSLAVQSSNCRCEIIGALNQKVTDPGALAEVLARDLARLSSDHYLLVLDEYDRADTVVDIQTFMEALLDLLPAQCHLVIGSRTLPRLPWVGLVARRQAVVLRDAAVMPIGFYS